MGIKNRIKEVVALEESNSITIALAGNPNVGKSTIYNRLTGLNQHTGNWPGKTVSCAYGYYTYNNTSYLLADLPGTYSLLSSSYEEEIAMELIAFGKPHAVAVVCDATTLERNLNLVLQITEITPNVIVVVNLIDEAMKKNIYVDIEKLSELLGVPVVATTARDGIGLNNLCKTIEDISTSKVNHTPTAIIYPQSIENAISPLLQYISTINTTHLNSHWIALRLMEGDSYLTQLIYKELQISTEDIMPYINKIEEHFIDNNKIKDIIVSSIVLMAEGIYCDSVLSNTSCHCFDRKIDKILTGKLTGIPIMLLLLSGVLWLTITGANYPSQLLSSFLFSIEQILDNVFTFIGLPIWLTGVLVHGVYRVLAWVISVMLPPMAIFFPLFTLLEDFGYLPRVAFNLDNHLKKSGACGKQALTMCMGLGCNAAGVIGCRIIDSPRERLIAILTNNFMPCNGRFPTLIAIITMFMTGMLMPLSATLLSAFILTLIIVMGIILTMEVSKFLSHTILKGEPSSFVLELPPYRRPQLGRVIVSSIMDRTIFVLSRAMAVAAPAGAIIWLMANIQIFGTSILNICSDFLNPLAQLMGMDGVILLAFILGFPANEIVVPIIIMSYMSTGTLVEFESLGALRQLLISNGWTLTTAICTMIFSLSHWPCSTTVLTIKKEAGGIKWALLSIAIPTIIGIVLCMGVNLIFGMIF